jgi:hypothetical protein
MRSRHLALATLVLLTAGVLAAVLVGPVMGARPNATPNTTYTRAVSCAGIDFTPTDTDTDLTSDGGSIWRSSSNGHATVACNASLPHGAVVKRVDFTVVGYATAPVSACGLYRVPQAASSAQNVRAVATVPSANSGTRQRVSTSNINAALATVNNAAYAYFLECQLPYLTTLYSGDVVYAITATNG